jgi:hypothetical protein
MKPNDRLCALANSLPATIRWRFCDYEQLLKKELQMLAAPPRRVVQQRGTYEPRTE